MKVLKKGTGQKGWAKKRVCTGAGNNAGGCRAVLLVEETDVFQTSHSDYTGDTDYYLTFKCPECGCLTDIGDSSFPYSPTELPTYEAWSRKQKKEKETPS